jgi:Flp pilus assembly protein TadD
MAWALMACVAACGTIDGPPRLPASPVPAAVAAWNSARLAIREGRTEEALAHLRRSLTWRPPFIPAHRAYQELMRARGLGHVVYERYRAGARERPDSAAAQYLLGRLLGDLDRQERAFRRAIRLDDGLSWGHHGLGVVKRRRGRLEAARRCFLRARGRAPNEAEHAIALADLERVAGRLEEASRVARISVELDVASALAWSRLSQIEARRGLGPEALEAARRACVLTGEGRWHRAAFRRCVLALGSRDDVAAALEAQSVRLASGAEDSTRLVDVGLYRVRLGDLVGGVAALKKAETLGADVREIVGPWRRALVRLGRFGEALRVDGLAVPSDLRDGEGNLMAARWDHARTCAAEADRRPGNVGARRRLGEALLTLGWHEEAMDVLVAADTASRGASDVSRALGRALAVRSVVERFAVAMKRGYREDGGDGAGLDAALADVGRWMRRAGLEGDPTRARRTTYPFAGELVEGRRSGSSDLHDLLLEHGLLLILGQPAGHAPEALLGEAVSIEHDLRIEVLGQELICDRMIVANMLVGSSRSVGGAGDLSGLALEGFYLLNLDEITSWPFATPPKDPIPPWRPVEASDRDSLDWPGGVLGRLGAKLTDEAKDVRLDLIARHEEGHLLDAARYLPIGSHLWAGLRLVAGLGFSAKRVQGRLEGDAQLVALAAARHPHAALYALIASGHRRDSAPPHSLGYHIVLREMVHEIATHAAAHPAIDPEANILQQLDRLTGPEIRRLARTLLERRGLP